MATERLLRKASQVLRTAGGRGVLTAALLAAPLGASAASAYAQYAVSDSQLQSSVGAALHNDSKLSGASITATASQGVVTLSGNVADEAARLEAEQVAAGVSGVRSIQDNLNLPAGASTAAPPEAAAANTEANGAPPPPDAAPDAAPGAMPPPPPAENAGNGQYTPYPNGSAPAPHGGPQPGYGSGNYANQGYAPQAPSAGSYPGDSAYGPRGNVRPQAPTLAVSPQQQNNSGPVTVAPGTLLSVRTTVPLSTNNLKPGDSFQATAASDVYANGVVAIPRGALLTGQVVEAKNAGPFGGSPKLDLKLTSVQLGPNAYPIDSEVWSSQGPSKTGYTATNTVGGAVVGALIGGVAGGGVGAGVGAVAGGASGALISGATRGPRLDLPPEALLQFRIADALTVQPVPYDEAERLAASAPQQPVLRQRPVYVAAPYPYVVRPYPYAYYYPRPYAYYYPRY